MGASKDRYRSRAWGASGTLQSIPYDVPNELRGVPTSRSEILVGTHAWISAEEGKDRLEEGGQRSWQQKAL
jgi:hypothetical protein